MNSRHAVRAVTGVASNMNEPLSLLNGTPALPLGSAIHASGTTAVDAGQFAQVMDALMQQPMTPAPAADFAPLLTAPDLASDHDETARNTVTTDRTEDAMMDSSLIASILGQLQARSTVTDASVTTQDFDRALTLQGKSNGPVLAIAVPVALPFNLAQMPVASDETATSEARSLETHTAGNIKEGASAGIRLPADTAAAGNELMTAPAEPYAALSAAAPSVPPTRPTGRPAASGVDREKNAVLPIGDAGLANRAPSLPLHTLIAAGRAGAINTSDVQHSIGSGAANTQAGFAPLMQSEAQTLPTGGWDHHSGSIEKNEYKQIVTSLLPRPEPSSTAAATTAIATANEAPANPATTSHSKPSRLQPLNGVVVPGEVPQDGSDSKILLDGTSPLPIASTATAQARPAGFTKLLERNSNDISSMAATLTANVSTDSTPHAIDISPQFGSAEWKPAFASNVQILVNNGITNAALQLHPADLGPIEVRIQMIDQRADISFTVANADAGAAIQSALPELREQLERGGIQLGQTSVGNHGGHGQDAQHASTSARHVPLQAHAPDTETSALNQPAPRTPAPSAHRIDFYA